MAKPRGKADGRPGGKILGCYRGGQAEHGHQDKLEDALGDDGVRVLPQARIHQARDDQRDNQLEQGLQQFESGAQNAFLPIMPQLTPELFHRQCSQSIFQDIIIHPVRSFFYPDPGKTAKKKSSAKMLKNY